MPNGKGIKHFYKTDSYIDGNFVDGFAEGYCKQTFEQTWEKTQPYYAGEFKRNIYNLTIWFGLSNNIKTFY
jgi:hypothetical protein